ncbi:MAG: hypothetical protein ABIQ61_04950, partial [Ornithinibacter sp.]
MDGETMGVEGMLGDAVPVSPLPCSPMTESGESASVVSRVREFRCWVGRADVAGLSDRERVELL